MLPEVVCLGEALVDLIAPVGMKLEDAPSFERAPGGAPANVAAALGRLGVAVGFIGKVGDDHFGRLLCRSLVAAGVDTSTLLKTSEARTTLAWVAMPDAGTPEYLFYRHPGADSLLEAGEVPVPYIRAAHIFHFGSFSLSLEPARSATLQGIALAREAGATISYDPNWRPLAWNDHSEGLAWVRHALPLADIVKLNEDEVSLITGSSNYVKGAGSLLEDGCRLVVVTLGERGSYFTARDASGLVPACPIELVDSVGCGDAFMGALLAGLCRTTLKTSDLGEPGLRRIVAFANAAAALTATRKGAMSALPTRHEVESLLASRASEG